MKQKTIDRITKKDGGIKVELEGRNTEIKRLRAWLERISLACILPKDDFQRATGLAANAALDGQPADTKLSLDLKISR